MNNKRCSVWVMPLSPVEIAALPFPETAKMLGGILIVEEDKGALEHELDRVAIAELRRLFTAAISETKNTNER